MINLYEKALELRNEINFNWLRIFKLKDWTPYTYFNKQRYEWQALIDLLELIIEQDEEEEQEF